MVVLFLNVGVVVAGPLASLGDLLGRSTNDGLKGGLIVMLSFGSDVVGADG